MNYTLTQANEYSSSANAARPIPLLFRVSLTQAGTEPPSVVYFENTIGGMPVWTRLQSGVFIATLEGAFPQDKFAGFLGCAGRVQWLDVNSFSVSALKVALSPPVYGDGVLNRTSCFVFVYP